MLTDAHCHPFDLVQRFPQTEEERRRLGVIAAASACDMEEYAYNARLALKAADEKAAPLLPCFAIHPQMFAMNREQKAESKEQLTAYDELLTKLEDLAATAKIAAVGECGFDLYNAAFRETETIQDRIFAAHLEIALKHDLPVVLHVRRAMHKIFAVTKSLSKCKSVVFHSWPGALEEGQALLRQGVNACFSFGNVIMKGHKQAMRCCALLPAERLLTETDAPFQPRKEQSFSQWADLPVILETAASLRNEAGNAITGAKELENLIEINFRRVFT